MPLPPPNAPVDVPVPPRGSVAYDLPRIPYLRLRVTLHALEPAGLPSYKGSTLRGAFGHALRRTVCAIPEQECESCRLRAACAYTRLFETYIEGDPPPLLRGLETAPRPYVFEPRTDARTFAPGDPLLFDLLLLGQAVDLQAYAVLALERMAAAGLGLKRHRFALDRVETLAPDGTLRPVVQNGRATPRGLHPPALPREDGPATRARLRFRTPTRIKLDHHLARSVDFRSLAFAMLRRTLELAHFHLPGAAVDWTFRAYLEQADRVRVLRSDLRWHDWERYSNRQGRKMTLGGFEGTLDLEGDLHPFAPLLRTAEIVHVGKGATFGLGKVEVEGV